MPAESPYLDRRPAVDAANPQRWREIRRADFRGSRTDAGYAAEVQIAPFRK